ncbi:hypothetical protein RclHR1_28560002 [Rhizophagus clarus]|uniref:Reverse transcriptase RNase H-like domain-containing protein n=1 Tax=Rhizophagus clarus TaxID=94130 RepID=A0A2Z6R425_9GLOM|nr:hypothetical protein RclHR1_28560002 [Rhizophagus clarus]
MRVPQYNFKIKHRPEKLNANADALSRIPKETFCFLIELETYPEPTKQIFKISLLDFRIFKDTQDFF